MANVKISELVIFNPANPLTGTEEMELVQAGQSKGGFVNQFPTYLNSLAVLNLGNNLVAITPSVLTVSLAGGQNPNPVFLVNDHTGALAFSVTGNGEVTIGTGDLFMPNATLHANGRIEITSPGIGITLQSPNGTHFLLTVDNAGQLNVT